MPLQTKREDLVGAQILDAYCLGLHCASTWFLADLNELGTDANLQSTCSQAREARGQRTRPLCAGAVLLVRDPW